MFVMDIIEEMVEERWNFHYVEVDNIIIGRKESSNWAYMVNDRLMFFMFTEMLVFANGSNRQLDRINYADPDLFKKLESWLGPPNAKD